MTGALLFQTIGLFGIAFSSGWWSVVPMFLVGMATNGFVPAQQAYISDQVAFERRGRALGAVEASFAVAGIVLLPLVGWILERWGWQAPFYLLGMLSLGTAVALWVLLPKTETRTVAEAESNSVWRLVRKQNVLAVVGVALFAFIAVGMFMTFWGIWVNQDYGLGAAEVGVLATVIGVAELSGAVFSGLFIDRIGKRRGNMLGLLGAAVMFGLIPVMGKTISMVRLVLVLTVLMIEFTIVSLFPLYGEQAPQARATIFSMGAFGTAVGFMIGPPLATSLWDWRGVMPIAVVGAASLLVALGLVWGFLYDDGGRLN
jgi:predicted MFS family arabinose efflux permease